MSGRFTFRGAARQNPFASMPTSYLVNNYFLFRAIRSDWLFARHERLLQWLRRTAGDRFFFRVLKATMGRQFTCGENVAEATSVVKSLTAAGLHTAVNYMAEFDEAETRESTFDANKSKYLESIDLCKVARSPTFAAVKISGLLDFALLKRASQLQAAADAVFLSLPAPPNRPHWRRKSDLEAAMGVAPDAARHFLDQIQRSEDKDHLHFAEWRLGLCFLPLASPPLARTEVHRHFFGWSAEEHSKLALLAERLRQIAERASAGGAGLLIDAEQSYFFDAITALIEQLACIYNVDGKPLLVFNTIQAYLCRSRAYIEYELSKAEVFGPRHRVALKLVRGAYLAEERQIEGREKREIAHPSKAATDANYNECAALIINSLTSESRFVLATHNEKSAALVVQQISQNEALRKRIVFATLYGLSDYMAYSCLAEGLLTLKYLPYGEKEITLPYLLRRGADARAAVVDDTHALGLLKEELRSRLFSRRGTKAA